MTKCFKFVACVCIVCIHTAAFSDLIEGYYYYLESCVFRLAVPFFFVTSRYFFGEKLTRSSENKPVLSKYVKRLGIPLVFWELVNIGIEVAKQLFVKKIPVRLVARNVLQSIVFYPYGALWYVQALLIALILVTYVYKRGWLGRCILLSACLYIIGLLGNSYYFVVYGTRLQWLVDGYLSIFVSTRNALFVALYFVSVGVWIADCRARGTRVKHKQWCAVLFFMLHLLEVSLIRNCRSADDKSMFVSFLFLIPTLFALISESNLRVSNARRLRQYSTGIYFMHKAVIHGWLLCFAVVGLEVCPTVEFLLVLASCFAVCSVAYKIDNRYINMLVR